MLDARYHLYYSIVIFLMLGIGILIGASLYGPVQVHQQNQAVQKLASETNTVVQQRNEIQGRLDNDEQALASLRPLLVHGKLLGKRIVLIQTGDYADGTQSANQCLEDAGATVTATVVLTEQWSVLSTKQRAALASISDTPEPAAQDKALLASLASVLVHGTLIEPSGATVLTKLQQIGLMTLSGDLSQPCMLFVLVGGGSGDTSDNAPDAGLLEGFKALPGNVTVAGCEPSSAVASSISVYQSFGIATVDCIDLPLGQIALPLALRGELGDYGIKATAKQRLPDSLTGASAP
ncbi:MAG: copper transporter [Janthinobacterium lividum]